MKSIRILKALGISYFYLSSVWANEETWWTQTLRSFKESISPSDPILFDASHSFSTPALLPALSPQPINSQPPMNPYYNPYDSEPLSPQEMERLYPTAGQYVELATFHPAAPLAYESIYYQPLPNYSTPGIAPYNQLFPNTPPVMVPPLQNSGTLLFTSSAIQTQRLTDILKPPLIADYISSEDVERMKKDKKYTNQLLDLIYWDIIKNCYTVENLLNNPYVRQVLNSTPDHRLWKIIVELDAFSHFPGLVEFIHHYADSGLATAQHILGKMYYLGVGVTKNKDLALQYTQAASNQGFALGQNALGCQYYDGDTVVKDPYAAVSLWSEAANQNYKVAQSNLAQCYLKGHGVDKNIGEAIRHALDGYCQNGQTILQILKPTEVNSDNSSIFIEDDFYAEVEAVIGELILAYSEELDLSALPESQWQGHLDHHEGTLEKMLQEVQPLIMSLKAQAPGLFVNCIELYPGIKTTGSNTLPHYFDRSYMKEKSKSCYYSTFGDENCSIVVNYRNVFKSLSLVMNKAEELSKIEIKEVSGQGELFPLETKVRNFQTLMNQESVRENKEYYTQKLREAECDLKAKKAEIAMYQSNNDYAKQLKKNTTNLRLLKLLLEDYVTKGVHNRNEWFLKKYPFLKIKARD